MAATADVLAAIDPGQQPPQSVRETGVLPWRMATTRDALPVTLAEVTAQEAASAGRLAVIVPDARVRELGEAVSRAADSPPPVSSKIDTNAPPAAGSRAPIGSCRVTSKHIPERPMRAIPRFVRFSSHSLITTCPSWNVTRSDRRSPQIGHVV